MVPPCASAALFDARVAPAPSPVFSVLLLRCRAQPPSAAIGGRAALEGRERKSFRRCSLALVLHAGFNMTARELACPIHTARICHLERKLHDRRERGRRRKIPTMCELRCNVREFSRCSLVSAPRC